MYERIESVSNVDKVRLLPDKNGSKHGRSASLLQGSGEPPPVPERTGPKRKISATG